MNIDVEELLRDGMERFTAGVRAPDGLLRAVTAARRQRRRRLAIRSAVACGAAAITVAAAVAVTVSTGSEPGRLGGTVTAQARDVAYVMHQVQRALTGEHLVFEGQTTSTFGPSITWAYGPRNRFEEFTARSCGHALPNGSCTGHGGSESFLASGTALVGGKLTVAYVTYFDHKYSLASVAVPRLLNPCSMTARLSMGGTPIPTNGWSDFINETLACGAASVTGDVWINGVHTTRITGLPITVKLSAGYAKGVREKYARASWTIYVNPATYLPVRMEGSTRTFGGPSVATDGSYVTNVQWLPPTAVNIAEATVTIPPGYKRVGSAANQ